MSTPNLSGALWRKSSYSGTTHVECVEVADLAPVVAVRDSVDPDGPRLVLGAGDLRVMVRRIKAGGGEVA